MVSSKKSLGFEMSIKNNLFDILNPYNHPSFWQSQNVDELEFSQLEFWKKNIVFTYIMNGFI